MKEKHESYGMLQFSRASCTDTALFGSSIKHSNIIIMRLSEAHVDRMLNEDYYQPDGLIAEVRMSLAQFSEAITSMNMGTGVPVTITWLRNDGQKKPCPFISKQKQFEQEFENNINKTNEELKALIEDIEDIFDNKKSINKKDREEILSKLSGIYRKANGDRAFVYKQFNRQINKTVQEAKKEIEAFAQNRMLSIANEQLAKMSDTQNFAEIKSTNENIELTLTDNSQKNDE